MNDHLLCMDVEFVPVLVFRGTPALALVDIELAWDPDQPLLITMAVVGAHRTVTWEISRDLIADGLDRGTAGVGDVSVLPDLDDPRCVELVLSTPSGRAALIIEREHLHMFLMSIERHGHAATVDHPEISP